MGSWYADQRVERECAIGAEGGQAGSLTYEGRRFSNNRVSVQGDDSQSEVPKGRVVKELIRRARGARAEQTLLHPRFYPRARLDFASPLSGGSETPQRRNRA